MLRQGAIAVVALLAFGAGFWAAGPGSVVSTAPRDEPAASVPDAPAPQGLLSALPLPRHDRDGSPALGAAAPRVTLLWLSDLTAPEARDALPVVARLLEEYADTVQLIWRTGPLAAGDPMAEAAARAGLAAHRQERFWELHDLLLAGPPPAEPDGIRAAAARIGLDLDRFEADYASDVLVAQVAEEQAAARALSVTITPTFFLNGRPLPGVWSYDDFRALLEESLQFAAQALDADAAPETLHETLARFQHPAGQRFVDLMVHRRAPDEAAAPSRAGHARPAPVRDRVLYVPLDPTSPWRGAKDPIVHLVLFADFECPFSKALGPTLGDVLRMFPEDVRLVWKNLPQDYNAHAPLAAEAALAAHGQGRFWEMHDLLFANQGALARDDLIRYAEQLQLDLTGFRHALDNGIYRERVQREKTLAEGLGAPVTPQMFINGRALRGARTKDAIAAVIRQEIGRAEALMSRGAVRKSVYGHIMRDAARR